MLKFTAATEEETIALGAKLAREILPQRGVVILTGNLGAGKTTLVKGIAQGRADVDPDEVASPTFTLIHEYGEPVSVYHIDLYRLDTDAEVRSLGLDEIADRNALVLIEWGERFRHLLPPEAARIEIAPGPDDQRMFLIRLENAS